MRPSPVRLDHYYFTSLSITPVDGYEIDLDSESPYPNFSNAEFGIFVRLGEPDLESPNRGYMLHLELKGAPKDGRSFPYKFVVGADAIVTFRGQSSDAVLEVDLVSVNAAGMLYSAIREVLFSLTARFANGPMMLPSASFMDLRREKRVRPGVSGEPEAETPRSRSKKKVSA